MQLNLYGRMLNQLQNLILRKLILSYGYLIYLIGTVYKDVLVITQYYTKVSERYL